jgi:hypothetical protein
MPDITPQQIEAARKTLADALQQRDTLLQQRAASKAVAASAARRLAPDDGRLRELNDAAEQADRNWQDSHAAVTSSQSTLQELVAQFVGQAGDGDFTALSTQYPLALFPVRIETRFQIITDNPRLQIRVYPDEILADSHEPSLTQTEIDAGHAYWTASWPTGETLEAWQGLISNRSAQRAAWIAIETQPTNWATHPAGAPVFKDPPLRPDVWTRGVEARVLPDRWIAQAYRGGVLIHQAISAAIVEPLVLTLNPNANPADKVDPYGDGFTIAKELQWTIDFDAARAVGMAFEMPIEPSEIELGFDRLLVFGVKPSATPDSNTTALGELFDNHHYTRGLAFVKQGTPTNNTTGQPSGFPPPDPNGANSFAVERNDQKLTANSDGVRFMQALGLGPDAAAHLANAGITEQIPAQAMNHALFPVTMGYFLEQMMAPQFGDEVVDAAREFFQDNVRARGPLPAFRVGAVPYGILPVSSLNGWFPDRETSTAEHNLPDLLRHLLPYWLSAVNQAPHVGQTGDPDGDMSRILAMEASAREVWVRSFAGKTLVANVIALFGVLPQNIFLEVQALITANVLASLGHPEWIIRAMELMGLKDATQFRYSFVTDQPLSETDPLPDAGNYIAQLATATTVDQILAGYNDKEPTALLYQLLRHATLRENDRVVFNTLVDFNLATVSQRIEPELTAVATTIAATPTTWQRMATIVPAISTKFIADAVLSERAAFNVAMTSYQEALGILQKLPTAELQRLLTETMDVCSHRIDAWITGLYSARLDAMREETPGGVHLGAYAWVENLQARFGQRTTPVTLPDGRQVVAQVDNGGYIHAPTMTHAAAAAVLRNAYLSQAGGNGQRYEIDLSSARVRQAAFVLDGVRQGQPVGAVLGYIFESNLHEQQLDAFIDNFRAQFPLQSNPATDTGLPTEAVAARDVVDGLRLRNAFVAGTDVFGPLIPPPTAAERSELTTQLQQLDEVFDSLSDLVMAESVYHLVQSNMSGASATLDAAIGQPAPDPAVVQQPRGGTSLTHRLAVVLGDDPAVIPGKNARGKAEPYLHTWVGSLLGDLSKVVCKVDFTSGVIASPRNVTLDDLALEPLDVLSLTRSVAIAAMASDAHATELDRRVRDVILKLDSAAANIAITYDIVPSSPDGKTFAQIFELAKSIASVVSSARALRSEDLVLPQDVPATPNPAPPDTRAVKALADFQAKLANLTSALTPNKIREALQEASLYGIGESYPFIDDASLPDQATGIATEMQRRVTTASAPGQTDTAVMAALFGQDFLFLPRFQLSATAASELDLAITQGPTLASLPHDFMRWFQQSARVRPALDAWRRLTLYTGALGGPPAPFELAQLPFQATARWAALPFAPQRPPAGLISLALHRPVKPATNQVWAGLFLDDWTEVIPDEVETTAIGFHYDDPGAEAGQAVLLAIPPGEAQSWDIVTFANILNETADLAKVRAVDLELLPALGQLLPAIYLSTDLEDNTITTNFATKVMNQQSIVGLVRSTTS